jgi:hypothetical protein
MDFYIPGWQLCCCLRMIVYCSWSCISKSQHSSWLYTCTVTICDVNVKTQTFLWYHTLIFYCKRTLWWCIVTVLQVGWYGFDLLRKQEISLFLNIQLAVGPTQPPIQWMPRAKQPGLYAYHCSPCDAEMKNAWKYCLLPLMLYPFNLLAPEFGI